MICTYVETFGNGVRRHPTANPNRDVTGPGVGIIYAGVSGARPLKPPTYSFIMSNGPDCKVHGRKHVGKVVVDTEVLT